MNTNDIYWTGERARVYAHSDARDETAAQIAVRTAATLTGINQTMGNGVVWEELHSSTPLNPESLDDVERMTTDFVYRDDFGDEFPNRGFMLNLLGRKGSDAVSVDLKVGSRESGRRRASNNMMVSFNGGPRPIAFMESILATVVTCWEPAAAAARDTDTAMLGRGGFAPIIGQRTWLHTDTGTITTTVDGVTASPLADGALLSADDSWTPQQVIDAMNATLAENTITTIPRGPQP